QQLDDAAFGDVGHVLVEFNAATTAVGDFFDFGHELGEPTFLDDAQSTISKFEFQTTCGKEAAEHQIAGVGSDVDEAADASRDMRFERQPGDIDAAVLIDLHER